MRNILSQFSSTPKVEIDDPMETSAAAEPAQDAATEAAPTEPEQVPYVPAASRSTKTKAKKDKDEVVTVKKAKKRKAEVVAPAAEATTTPGATAETAIEVEPSPAKRAKVSGEKTKVEKPKSEKAKGKKKAVNIEEIPDFDYSQEPNQLDTFAPESTTGKIKKQKKPKKRESARASDHHRPCADMRVVFSHRRHIQLPQTASEPVRSPGRKPIQNLQKVDATPVSFSRSLCMHVVIPLYMFICHLVSSSWS